MVRGLTIYTTFMPKARFQEYKTTKTSFYKDQIPDILSRTFGTSKPISYMSKHRLCLLPITSKKQLCLMQNYIS